MAFDPTGLYRLTLRGAAQTGGGLFAPYDVSVKLPNGVTVEAGRFSLPVLHRLALRTRDGDGLVFRCGAFCETAHADIIVGGEHDNDALWNIALQGANAMFGAQDPTAGLLETRPTFLGDNVLISHGAVVLGGVALGDGVVVGAGALVTDDCEPFGVYVGSPARRLRSRFSAERIELFRRMRIADVHAHHVPDLPRLARDLESGRLSIDDYFGQVTFLKSRPKLHFLANAGERLEIVGLDGVSIDGEMLDPADAKAFAPYFSQDPRGELDWRPDIFHAMGLS